MNDREAMIRIMTGGIMKMMLLKWGVLIALNFVYRKMR